MKTHVPEFPDDVTIKPVLAELPKPYFQVVRAGVVNRNGMLFTKECLEKATVQVQERVNKRTLFVHAPHEASSKLDLGSVVGIVKDAHFDGESVNIAIDFIKSTYVFLAVLAGVHMSFQVEGECAGSGNEIYQMAIEGVKVYLAPMADLI